MRLSPSFAARISLALLLASAAPGLATAQGQSPSASRVVALREATLKSGASAADFERYFADSVAGPINRHVPGPASLPGEGGPGRARRWVRHRL